MRLTPWILAIWPTLVCAASEPVVSDQWLLCPLNTDLSKQSEVSLYIAPERFDEQQKDETRISAEKIENAASDMTVFSGNVLIERSELRLRADKVVFDRGQQLLNMDGKIHIDANNLAIDGEMGWLNLKDNSGEFKNSRYLIPESHFQGRTPSLKITKDKQTILINSRFSSCFPPKKSADEDWYLQTSFLKLDRQEQLGTAKHAVLWFKGVPIFYSPYISFPLGDKRRSGFLMPAFGSSNSRGTELSVPWYWNIAPNHDAIITPRYMAKRGTQLNTNYRYLTQASKGKLDIEYLDKDQLLKDKRYYIKFNNHTDLGEQVDFDINASDASDGEYFRDLGTGIGTTNITHLERKASLKYFNGPWTLNSTAQTYETIDEDIALANRPYRRLPQVTLRGKDNFSDSDIQWSLNSEWVDFKHEDTSIASNKSIGSRFNIYPKLSWPLQGSSWFFTPSAGVRYSQYNITDSSGTKLDVKDRSLSTTSLDAGLFFEREINDNKTIQTLEPRLYYLRVPFKDQSALPLFDTGEYDFTFAQLFRENRFTGVDRIADSDQVTLALSSRFIDKKTGNEFLNMSIGQIFYNENRRVNLTNAIETSTKSDLISEISGRWGNWNSRAAVQWNPEQNKTDKNSAQLRYQGKGNRIFNIAYRFRRDFADETKNLEQTDLAMSWPLNNKYSLLGRWNYSLTEQRDIEVLFGFEYESCCWAMRIISQRYLQDPDNNQPYNSSIMFQLILKGLGSVADKKATSVLKRAILGYQSEY